MLSTEIGASNLSRLSCFVYIYIQKTVILIINLKSLDFLHRRSSEVYIYIYIYLSISLSFSAVKFPDPSFAGLWRAAAHSAAECGGLVQAKGEPGGVPLELMRMSSI